MVAAVCLSFLQSIVDSFQHLGLPLFNGNPVRFNGNCAANQVQALVLLGNPGQNPVVSGDRVPLPG